MDKSDDHSLPVRDFSDYRNDHRTDHRYHCVSIQAAKAARSGHNRHAPDIAKFRVLAACRHAVPCRRFFCNGRGGTLRTAAGCTVYALRNRADLPLIDRSRDDLRLHKAAAADKKFKSDWLGRRLCLGVNQTVMFALSMLVITALVGTRDLGQEVYIALTKADTGRGLVAGLSVAFIAIITDRLISAAAKRRKQALGL